MKAQSVLSNPLGNRESDTTVKVAIENTPHFTNNDVSSHSKDHILNAEASAILVTGGAIAIFFYSFKMSSTTSFLEETRTVIITIA